MANVVPFKGIHYNFDKISNMADVVAPPYDVISKEQQEMFHKKHPNNIVRLILGRTHVNGGEDHHTRAANFFNTWLSESVLIRDNRPAIYRTTIEFSMQDRPMVRHGMIALVGLEPFDKKVVLPHETTYSKVKSERLGLFKKCHANFCSIFSIYSDPDQRVETILKNQTAGKAPDMDFVDDEGHVHKLWRITDPYAQSCMGDEMMEKTIFIADGHHRYETALNYRDWVSENDPHFDSRHPANYVMMYLCSMEDSGLIILPAHRILKGIPEHQRFEFIQTCRKYFEIISIPCGENLQKAKNKFSEALRSNLSKNIIGVCIRDIPELYLMTLKQDIMEKMFGNELSEAIRQLDVTVLTRLVFMEVLGFDQNSLDDESLIAYSIRESDAIDDAISGKGDMSFILNPTKTEQVRRIAEEGQKMPRKSTYFYPKVITGQVINSLKP